MLPLLCSLVFLLVSQVAPHPFRAAQPHPASRIVRRTVDLNRFRLPHKATYKQSKDIDSTDLSRFVKRATYVETATALLKETSPGVDFRLVNDHYVGTNGVAHVRFVQIVNGLDVDNADFNVNVGKDGAVLSFGNSFYTGELPALVKRDTVSPVEAVKGANSILQLSINADGATAKAKPAPETYIIEGTTGAVQPPTSKLVYFQTQDSTLRLAWRVETDIYTNWLLIYIDAITNEEILGVADYSSDATYNVYPWGVNDPTQGSRTLISDPWDTTASEFGYHSDGTTTYSTTRGNNAIAQTNWDGDANYLNETRPQSEELLFDYPYYLNETNPRVYADASVTQLFYTANMFHDLLYLLGFNEAAGNFEANINGQGGIGGDFVILNAQDGSGLNNANFATPPDGQNGRMRMYIWNRTQPYRDCSFEAGVVLHEYGHGLSNRLTGGPANSRCLSSLESGGMGEGWSDFWAIAIHLKSTDTRATDYPLGAWVAGNPRGIRLYEYSTSLTTNPLTYRYVNNMTLVHQIGTVWNSILYEALWNLIDKHGINDAISPSFDGTGVPTDGRYLTMKIVLDAMALQPCQPTFPQARDAIIDADLALTGGDNECELWTAFAKRGLGELALRGNNGTDRREDYSVPAGVCQNGTTATGM